jgi:hypothetical protein
MDCSFTVPLQPPLLQKNAFSSSEELQIVNDHDIALFDIAHDWWMNFDRIQKGEGRTARTPRPGGEKDDRADQ